MLLSPESVCERQGTQREETAELHPVNHSAVTTMTMSPGNSPTQHVTIPKTSTISAASAPTAASAACEGESSKESHKFRRRPMAPSAKRMLEPLLFLITGEFSSMPCMLEPRQWGHQKRRLSISLKIWQPQRKNAPKRPLVHLELALLQIWLPRCSLLSDGTEIAYVEVSWEMLRYV